MFEEQCHNLDIEIVKERIDAAETDATGTNFDNQVAAEATRQDQLQAEIRKKSLQMEQLEEEMPLNQIHNPSSKEVTPLQQLEADIVAMVTQQTHFTS